MKKDTDAIFTYGTALERYWTQADAWDEYMSHASAGAQEYVKKLQDSTDDIKLLAASYDSYMRKTQLGQSVNGSFTGAINAIRLYNSGLKTAGLTQKKFHEAIAETNPELDAYITKMEADGKKPTEWGYIWQTKKATIQTGLFTAGISLGTAALGLFAQKGNTTAAQVVGGLASVAGGITAVVSAIAMAEGALSLTAGVGWISAGLAALTAGIGAVNTASQRMREAWQADIDQLEQFKQSSEELADAYVNVSKYLKALRDGEEVGSEVEKRPGRSCRSKTCRGEF